MRDHIVISETLRQRHKVIYDEIKRIMEERFGEGDYTLLPLEELKGLSPDDCRNKICNKVRFFCVHTDDNIGLFREIIHECMVPCIVIRGSNIPNEEDWLFILRTLTREKTNDKIMKEVCCKKMFYSISEASSDEAAINSVRGAVTWVNNFYHAIRTKIENEIEKKTTEKITEILNLRAKLNLS